MAAAITRLAVSAWPQILNTLDAHRSDNTRDAGWNEAFSVVAQAPWLVSDTSRILSTLHTPLRAGDNGGIVASCSLQFCTQV